MHIARFWRYQKERYALMGQPGDVDSQDAMIGMFVEGVLRRLLVDGHPRKGHIVYGAKFRPPVGL